jgi:hypothetical protein
LAIGFILTPTMIAVKSRSSDKWQFGKLGYFAAIGLGFLFIEIPMIQHFILFLDNPSYSLATVLFALLFFSGVGSRFSNVISIDKAFIWLIILNLINIIFLKQINNYALGLPLAFRIVLTIILLAPTGFFMGIPFPLGIKSIDNSKNELIPWAWGVNGVFSVVSGVAAVLLAISFGFKFVFIIGTALYLIAWLLIRVPSLHLLHHPQ